MAAPAALLLVVAGCGNGGGGAASSGGAGGSSQPGGAASIVSVSSVDGSHVLANAQGQTLYSASVEKGGQIRCVASCTSFWQPVLASPARAKAASAELGRTFDTVRRPDGAVQLTYRSLPLYTFTAEEPGELEGNGFTDQFGGTTFHWAAASTGAAPAPAKGSGSATGGYSGGGYGY